MHIYSNSKLVSSLKLGRFVGEGSHEIQVNKPKNHTADKLVLFFSDKKWKTRTTHDKLDNIVDCTTLTVVDGVNYLDDEVSVNIKHNFDKTTDIVVHFYTDKKFIESKKSKI